MHIVVLNPVGVVGGAERVLIAAARQTRRLRPDWRISAVLGGPGPLADRLETLGVGVRVLPFPKVLAGVGDTQLRSGGAASKLRTLASIIPALPAAWDFLRQARHLVRTLRPTLLHSHGLKSHLLAAAARPAGVPVLWHVHDFYSHRPVAGKLLRRMRRGVTGGIAISKAVAADAAAVLPGVPITVVPNAVNLEQFQPGPADGTDLDRLAGMPPAEFVRVGLVATYANWKGHGVFLDALARVPNVRGYIVGGPIYATAGSQVSRDELQAQAVRLGIADRVGFVPFQADPAGVYRMLDVVVHASTRPEPFGLTIAEAMACGRAVVVANAGGAAELFTDGADALGHTPGDAASLAAAIRRLADDPALRTRLGTAARATAEASFAEDRFGEQVVAAYAAAANHFFPNR